MRVSRSGARTETVRAWAAGRGRAAIGWAELRPHAWRVGRDPATQAWVDEIERRASDGTLLSDAVAFEKLQRSVDADRSARDSSASGAPWGRPTPRPARDCDPVHPMMHLTSDGWVTEQWLRERTDLGHDLFDEMADGVILLNSPLPTRHQRLSGDLLLLLLPRADELALEAVYLTTMYPLGDEARNYRTPDLTVVRPEHVVEMGTSGGAELVVEILSPEDRTWEKLPFYFAEGVRELLVVDPDTKAFTLHHRGATGWEITGADDEGWVRLESVGLRLRTEASDAGEATLHVTGGATDASI